MKIGDKVSVLDDAISGTVTAIDGSTVLIETDDGFDMKFLKNELVIINEELLASDIFTKNIASILSEKQQDKKPGKSKKTKPKERSSPEMVVDLHIDKLTSAHKRMDNYDMLNLQIDTAKRQLDFAITKKLQKMVFIHGIGEGVLKAELETLFNRYDNIKFYEADSRNFGQGATEVYIFQNSTN